MGPLHAALAALGASVVAGERAGCLPVTVTGPLVDGGRIELPGDVSSQYLTALMLIGPLLAGGLRLELTTPLVSRPYVALTASVMASFGVGDVEVADDAVVVPPGRYRGDGVRGRTGRLVGQLPAGHGRRRRGSGGGARTAGVIGAGRRQVRRPARADGLHRRRRRHRDRRRAPPGRAAAGDRRRPGRCLGPRADDDGGRRHGGVADDDHRGRLRAGQGERPADRPGRRADPARRPHRRPRRRAAHPPGGPVARRPPGHPPRPSAGHGLRRPGDGRRRHRGAGARGRGEELAGLLDASASRSWPAGEHARDGPP